MPRYYFHLHDESLFRDEEGVELADDGAARDNGLRNAREMACAEVMEGHLVLGHSIEIVDEMGRPVSRIFFREAVGLDEL